MKILTVLGARPQFIKASVVSHAIREAGGQSEVVVHTGQHFDANMSEVFFEELGMAAPQHTLGIHGGSHGEMTGRMLVEIERVAQGERPDVVLVYGDTNSTLAGALVAAKLGVPVAHVEAGLRSFNRAMPEEINRILTDHVSTWLYAPTTVAVAQLAREGIPADRIVNVGDVMYDVALHHGARALGTHGPLQALGLHHGSYVLVTIHRQENTDDHGRLRVIADALIGLASDLQVVWPMHPRTRKSLQAIGYHDRLSAAVRVIDPVGYLGMVQLEKGAGVIATDSGGVQKEAFFHEVPCVTLRDQTEWVELVEAGWNTLVSPTDVVAVRNAIRGALGRRGTPVRPYGSGDAAGAIVRHLSSMFELATAGMKSPTLSNRGER